MLPEKIAFVDIETTGLGVTRDRIIEIGILRVENNQVTQRYQTLLNPETYVSPNIQAMTGITKEELDDAPTFYEVKDDILDLLKDCAFVAHNVRFDYGFLRNEFARSGISYSSRHFCTVKLSKYLYPQFPHHNLDAIIQRFGFPCEKRHRAFDDAKVICDFYQHVLKNLPEDVLLSAVNLALKKPTLPTAISPDILASLPEAAGVYIFYAENRSPLYVGKSINIRERVMSHFSNDHASGKEMKIAQQIHSIETIRTAGELGALLKESVLVKKLQPLYNRMLRHARKLVVLKSSMNDGGYQEVSIETVNEINADSVENILGVFRSQRQAKALLITLAKEHNLCEKYLQLEKTKTSCFAYRLGNCKGACNGKENPIFYNTRFLEAFGKYKMKKWPFKGPIIIKEKNELDEAEEGFVIDKWCLIGSIKTMEFHIHDKLENEYLFDLDTYKILRQYFMKKDNWKKITEVKKPEQSIDHEYSAMSL